jgi:hypothetical protein
MSLFSGQLVKLTLPIGSMTCPVNDETGKALRLDSTDTPGKGVISFSIQMVPMSLSHAGFVMKDPKQMLGFGGKGFKKRWMVLLPEALMYYDNEFSLEAPRNVLTPAQIASVTTVVEKSRDCILISAQAKTESWTMAWVDGEDEPNKNKWLNKLHRYVDAAGSAGGGAVKRSGSSLGNSKKTRRKSTFGF